MVQRAIRKPGPRPPSGEAPRCYLCGSSRAEVVARRLRYGERRKVYRCEECSLVYLFPQTSPQEERRFYEQEYKELFSQGKSPQELYESKIPEIRQQYEIVRPYLSASDDCLEVGCAAGYFLCHLRDKVRSVTGYEINPEFRRFCEKMGIRTVDDLDALPDSSYDRIFMFFLLEHLRDPVAYLRRLSRLLKAGGTLVVEVPNVEEILVSVYRPKAYLAFHYQAAHHFYFSRRTLEATFQKAGFRDVRIIPEQRYDLSNHLVWMLEGKPGGMGRYRHIFSEELERAYAEDLKRRYLCDTLFAIVEKPL